MTRLAGLLLILFAGWGAPGVRPAPPPDSRDPMRLGIAVPEVVRAGAPVPSTTVPPRAAAIAVPPLWWTSSSAGNFKCIGATT